MNKQCLYKTYLTFQNDYITSYRDYDIYFNKLNHIYYALCQGELIYQSRSLKSIYQKIDKEYEEIEGYR